ncbi:MAG: ThuA domain-containing protein [Steroidobacteraceae bacterium]|jgi:hypothetical protein|nr:ThuA domain-containing protein [Steroidobacteraceae bacterium]
MPTFDPFDASTDRDPDAALAARRRAAPATGRRLLVVTGGHPFDAATFGTLLDSLEGWQWTRWNHPEAAARIAAGEAQAFHALLFYDMAGYRFADGGMTVRAPAPEYVRALESLLDAGTGCVFLHHALAGWAAWPGWAELVGGRFLYAPDLVRGTPRPDSGYAPGVRYEAEVVAEHPVTGGLPPRFELVDELYLAEVFEADVVPLLRARHGLAPGEFRSAAAAIAGRDATVGPGRAPGSDLIAWARTVRAARLAYLQCGDGPSTFANAHFRRLLANALAWVAREPR